jgi:large subunit ribosomal protein L21
MYAVIRTGGKQYRVSEGDTLRIEKVAEKTGKIAFEVLMVGGKDAAKVGKPILAGAVVEGEVLREAKAKKVIHFRKKKEGWTKKRGHRQPFTEVKITSIKA